LYLLLALCPAAFAAQLASPCFWDETIRLDGQTYRDFKCSELQEGSSIAFDISSDSGFDDFAVLVLPEKEFVAWLKGDEARCSNVDCLRKDSYAKLGSARLSTAAAPYHVVVLHSADAGKAADFHATVSISVGAVIVGGQLTAAPPPPPANVCQAIQEALPSFCSLGTDCATISCDVSVYFDSFDVTVFLDFCSQPINLTLTVTDADNEFSFNYTVSIGTYLIPIPGASVNIPFIGNATLDAAVWLDGSRSNFNVSIGLEACLDDGTCFPQPPIAILTGVFDFTDIPCPPEDAKSRTSTIRARPVITKDTFAPARKPKGKKFLDA